jgi:hypothetical protein
MGQALLIRFEPLPEMAADKLFDRFSVTGAEDGADTDGHETFAAAEVSPRTSRTQRIGEV